MLKFVGLFCFPVCDSVSFGDKKTSPRLYPILGEVVAGAEGLEPSTKVLETHVLPLHHAPKRGTEVIIPVKSQAVNMNFQFYCRPIFAIRKENAVDNGLVLWYNQVMGKGEGE